MVAMSNRSLYVLFIFMISLCIWLFVFNDTHRKIGEVIPVFDSDFNVYFVVEEIFGLSSIHVCERGSEIAKKLTMSFGRISNLFMSPSDLLSYSCRKGFDSSIFALELKTKDKVKISDFPKIFFIFGGSISKNEVLISYIRWVDTKSIFVGHTFGDSYLAVLNLETPDLSDIVTRDSGIDSPVLIQETSDVLYRSRSSADEIREFKFYNLDTKEKRYLPIDKHIDHWNYNEKTTAIYFQAEGFVWEFDLESEKTTKLFELKEKIDFLVRHPVEEKFLIKISDNPKTLFYVDKRGVVSEAFSI